MKTRRAMLQMSAGLAAGAFLGVRPVRAASDPKIIEAAKKEGSVSLYTSASTGPSNAVAEAFRKKYGINVSVYRAGSADVATRVQSEEAANRPQADALYEFDFEAMCFRQHPSGRFGANQVKFLRLGFTDHVAKTLLQVKGSPMLLAEVAPLVQRMQQFYKH